MTSLFRNFICKKEPVAKSKDSRVLSLWWTRHYWSLHSLTLVTAVLSLHCSRGTAAELGMYMIYDKSKKKNIWWPVVLWQYCCGSAAACSRDRNHTLRVYELGDFVETFRTPKFGFSLVGIRMTHNISRLKAKCWDIFFWFEMLNVALGTVSEIICSVLNAKKASSFQDALKVLGAMPCTGYCILSILKSLRIKGNIKIFENLYHELHDMWPRGEVNEDDDRIIKGALSQSKYIIRGYYWCNNGFIICFLLPSYLTNLKLYLANEPLILTFEYWLPFNPFRPFIFEIMLMLQTWHGMLVIWLNSLGDVLLCTYLAHISMQFELISQRLRRLIYTCVDQQLVESYPLAHVSNEHVQNKQDLLKSFTESDWEATHQKELTDIVKRHQALIRLARDVEEMFSFSLLINFMYSSIIICMCGFFCVCIEKWNEVRYKSFLLTALSQTWVLCWYGQKIIDSSVGVTEVVYDCGWYNASQRIKSSILVILIRSQRSINVTTYGFSIISLESYSTILKTSWSYFTLLLNFFKTGGNTDTT